MIHARDDYNRIQDPAVDDPSLLKQGASAIGVSEPVILFRAKDKHFVDVLNHYRRLVSNDMDMPHANWSQMVFAIDEQIGRAEVWQAENDTKTPDL